METTTARLSRSRKVLVKLGEIEIAHRWATLIGVSTAAYESWLYGRGQFPGERLPNLFTAIVAVTEDRSLALWALTEIAGLREIGLELKPTARGTDADPIPVDALQVTQALGALSGKITAAGSEIDHMEAAAMLPSARQLVAEAQQMVTKLEVIAAITPQMKIPGAER